MDAISELSTLPGDESRSSRVYDENRSQEAITDKPLNPIGGFPDGGWRAWSVVAGAFASNICTFGWISCIGVFQSFYQQNYLNGYSPITISWIASLELAILFGGGFIVGRIYDSYGPRYLLIFGTFFHVLGLMTTSLSTKYYQIVLSQGIASPLGICCIFTPALSCVTTWFLRRRGLAIGIVGAGSSVGGVFLPIMLNRLIDKIGFPWAIRSVGFLFLGLLTFANFTLRSRMPPSPAPLSAKAYFRPFTERAYLMTVFSAFLYFFGLFVPINYIAAQAIHLGTPIHLAQYLIPILNGASLPGRIIPGFAADKFGAYNTQTAMAFFSGIIVLALWLPASSPAALIVFAVLYGFGSGTFVVLSPLLIAQISPIHEIGLRNGAQFGLLTIPALISNPIGGAFIASDNGGYTNIKIWTGVILLTGATSYAITRITLGGTKFLKKI
ncbi:major facilitator superfamily domain-containing protein [Xylaria telfairii]|nr:major facilitator superfamily domain-containing protein [Xylaria telfairii]